MTAEERSAFEGVTTKTLPKMSEDFERILTKVFTVDALKDYERLERQLHIGEERGDYQAVLSALDRSEDNARIAHKLYLAAKIEREAFDIEYAIIQGAMWNAATRVLQKEKDQGLRNKAITDGDVKGQCAAMFRDQWLKGEQRAARVKGTEEHMKMLTELWVSRCRTNQIILSNMRK